MYHNPDILVSTAWVEEHLNDPDVRLVESNEDMLLYPSGHIPNAVQVDWTSDLNDQIVRDYVSQADFEKLLSSVGIGNDTTVVFYGDKSNWWATYALWVFTLFGHKKVKLMNGGRLKWEQEKRPITRELPKFAATVYKAQPRDDVHDRALKDVVMQHVKAGRPLVDVRSPLEFTGERLHMEAYPNEGALRGGHIPGAKSVPWAQAVNPADGTFKSEDELRQLYHKDKGLKLDDDIVTYCRIGERSSLSWFVLKHLLGHTANHRGRGASNWRCRHGLAAGHGVLLRAACEAQDVTV